MPRGIGTASGNQAGSKASSSVGAISLPEQLGAAQRLDRMTANQRATRQELSIHMRLAGDWSALGKRMLPSEQLHHQRETSRSADISKTDLVFAMHEGKVTHPKRTAAHVRRASEVIEQVCGDIRPGQFPVASAARQPDSIACACGFVHLPCALVQSCVQGREDRSNGPSGRAHCRCSSAARKRFDERCAWQSSVQRLQ